MKIDIIASGECEKYSEHERLHKISDKSQVIGEFLEWLTHEKRVHLSTYVEKTDRHGDTYSEEVVFHYNIQDLLGEFFGIDTKKLEEEKQAMLRTLRGEQ